MLNASVKAFWRGCTPSIVAKFSNVGDAADWARDAMAKGWGSGNGACCTRLEVRVGSTLMHVFYSIAPYLEERAKSDQPAQ